MLAVGSFEEYFEEIKKIWKNLDSPNRIIPFCTPMKLNPKFLVIGINHSDFCPNDAAESKRIAEDFSKGIPLENTFIEHNHTFAKGLREVIKEVHNIFNDFDEKPTDEWLGTNRIGIQTDGKGAGSIEALDNYSKCQKDMDKVLKSLISYMKPKNIILAGNPTCENFFYPEGSRLTMANRKPKKILIDKDTKATTNIIPVWHLSHNWRTSPGDSESYGEKTVKRIKQAIEDGLCEI